MRKLLILLSILSLIGCGEPRHDPRAVPYIEEFERTFNVTIDFPVYVDAKALKKYAEYYGKPDLLGVARNITKGNTFVIVHEKVFSNKDLAYWLIFHELGHAKLRLKHNNETYEPETYKEIYTRNGIKYSRFTEIICPKNLMYATTSAEQATTCINEYGWYSYIQNMYDQFYNDQDDGLLYGQSVSEEVIKGHETCIH